MVAHLCVDAIGKVNGNGALGQVDNISLRGEDKDFVREDIHLHSLEVFLGVRVLLLEVHHLTEPGHLLIHFAASPDALASFLVLPVGSHTKLRYLVHGKGANLDFQRIPAGHNRGMQGLVAVGLGHSNIVLETARNGLPHGMDDPQDPVTVLDAFHQDADG